MTDNRYGRFTSMADAYRAGQRIGLQVGADNVRALLARRGELTAEMAGAIEDLHGAPPLAESPTAVDAFRMLVEADGAARGVSPSLVVTDEAVGWPTPRRPTLTEADGTVKPWDGSSYS